MAVKPEINRRNIFTIRVRDHELEQINRVADVLRISVTELHQGVPAAPRAVQLEFSLGEAPAGESEAVAGGSG